MTRQFAMSLLLVVLLTGFSRVAVAEDGRLVLDVSDAEVELKIISDRDQLAAAPGHSLAELPAFDFEFVSDAGVLIPVVTGPVSSAHPVWEYVLGVGRLEPAGNGVMQMSLPVSLQQRNQNCIHNGLLQVVLDAKGRAGNASLEIQAETCFDLKLNMSATMTAEYRPQPVPGRAQVIARYRANQAQRLPLRPIEDLAELGLKPDSFSAAGVIPVEDLSVFGVLLDGIHYRGGCQTRSGGYQFCDELHLPSYSLAKSLFAGLGLMRLQKIYPDSAEALIANYVPECASSGKWDDVRFIDALNMATGLYDSPDYQVDEGGVKLLDGFFVAETHAARIAFACNAYPKQQSAAQRWVYNTATTYVLGVAMNNFLREHGGGKDIYNDVLLPWWQPLALSPVMDNVRRTYDEPAQALTGYGMTWLADDLVRLAGYVAGQPILEQVDTDLLNAALQRRPAAAGYNSGSYRYQAGFWAKDVTELLGCAEQTWVPFLSGYGGLNVALPDNGIVYYYVSDAGRFSLNAGLIEIHKLRPICSGGT